VALNFASRRVTIRVPPPPASGQWRIGQSTHRLPRESAVGATLILEPLEAFVAIAG
jgi:hypothetical protein